MIIILIEGNLDTLHSYTIVNYFQLLELTKNNNIKVFFKNISNKWKSHYKWKIKNLQYINIDNNVDVDDVDVIYRITYPINIISYNKKIPIFVFLTVESDLNRIKFKNNIKPTKQYLEKNNIYLITPSSWCYNILKQHNLHSYIIPHGVNTTFFYKIDRIYA